ncbi:hypothetical protein F4819DRAFT_476529 [Hypoxylon fuscum]|nr:hypothetical protein F4819DRAFT_476529 [Hypoxylon fuscum]
MPIFTTVLSCNFPIGSPYDTFSPTSFGRSDSSETITYIGLAPIDWVPVDTVANMLQSFSLRPAREEPQIYDIVYEKAQPWNLLVDAVREWIGNSEVQVISLQDWVDKLRNISDPSPQDVANLPALKLLDFYETLGNGADYMRYATGHAKEVSGIEIPAIDKELLASGLESWNL